MVSRRVESAGVDDGDESRRDAGPIPHVMRFLPEPGISFAPTTMSDTFKAAVEQETRRLQAIHPTPDDIPGCMRVLDDFLSCNGESCRIAKQRFSELM